VTIKDIAQQAGVSIGSVHCALNDKPGVSDSTRQKIISIANQLQYQANTVAASLKSKPKLIAQAFPGPTEEFRYYFSHMWDGCRDYVKTIRDFNVDVVEVPYYNMENNLAEELRGVRERNEVDGLVAFGNMDAQAVEELNVFLQRGIPVILVGADIPQSGRLLSVMPNYFTIGKMLAEIITRQINQSAEILVCAGDVVLPSHNLVLQGLGAYLEENELTNPVYKIHTSFNNRMDYGRIVYELEKHPDIEACTCVYARGSLLLGQALKDTGRVGRVIAIGSDMFEENVELLREGVFTNLLNKNPYLQAYTAIRCMTDYLLRGVVPSKSILYTGSEFVFQSNLEMYDNGFYRLLL
jgi:LacI family transcriptional regulator